MKRGIFVCGPYCFVPANPPPLWVRADRCVAFVGCSFCGAGVGYLCSGRDGGERGSTHTKRRQLYTTLLKESGEDRNKRAVVVTVEDDE